MRIAPAAPVETPLAYTGAFAAAGTHLGRRLPAIRAQALTTSPRPVSFSSMLPAKTLLSFSASTTGVRATVHHLPPKTSETAPSHDLSRDVFILAHSVLRSDIPHARAFFRSDGSVTLRAWYPRQLRYQRAASRAPVRRHARTPRRTRTAARVGRTSRAPAPPGPEPDPGPEESCRRQEPARPVRIQWSRAPGTDRRQAARRRQQLRDPRARGGAP